MRPPPRIVPRQNPLFAPPAPDIRVAAERAAVKMTFASPAERNRFFRSFIRGESAREALAEFNRETAIFGFTKGQFSLIDLLRAALEKTGPAHLTVSTWTVGGQDLTSLHDLLRDERILSVRFLVDASFQTRQPSIVKHLVGEFGVESMRVTNNHAKFFLLRNDTWRVSCKTSMNLNFNPRFEDFDISADEALHDFLDGVVTAIFDLAEVKYASRAAVGRDFRRAAW